MTATLVEMTLADLSPAPTGVFARIAAGDSAAVREAVERFGSLVWLLARRWSHDPADAEDAAQEIFFDLWRSAGRYLPERASEQGFVAMIARRRLIDRARKRKRSIEAIPFPDDFDVPDDGAPETSFQAEAGEARAVLASLSPAQRRTLELALLEGKTHEEIARETGTPLGTVKSHIRRGLERARKLLGARQGGDA